jgi:hypothetical protein
MHGQSLEGSQAHTLSLENGVEQEDCIRRRSSVEPSPLRVPIRWTKCHLHQPWGDVLVSCFRCGSVSRSHFSLRERSSSRVRERVARRHGNHSANGLRVHVVPSPAAETATSPASGRGDVGATTLAFCINHNTSSFRHFHQPTPALCSPEYRGEGMTFLPCPNVRGLVGSRGRALDTAPRGNKNSVLSDHVRGVAVATTRGPTPL